MKIIREPGTFSNAKALYNSYRYEDIVEGILEREGRGSIAKVLPMTDPPEHTRLRAITNSIFNNRRVQTLQVFMNELANQLVDGFIGDGQAEIVSQFAVPLPVTTIGELLSLPRERWRDVMKWQTAYSSCAGNYVDSPEQAEKFGHDLAEMQNFIVGVLDERRRSPGDDVLTELLNNNPTDYPPLTEPEIIAIAAAFIAAGHESTTTAIVHMVQVLAERPDVFRALRDAESQDKAIRLFVEEVLRMRPPLNGQPRIVTQDTEIEGVPIPAGAKVIIANFSANRDESIFGEDAQQFDMTRRSASRHVTFGGGIHVCLGAMLARAEMQTAGAVLVNRLDNLKLAKCEFSAADYKRSLMDWNYILKRLDVEFDARA